MPALTKDQIAKAIAENVGLQRNQSVELVEILVSAGSKSPLNAGIKCPPR